MRQGFALHAAVPPDVLRATAQESERLGYASFWVNHPGPIDGLAALGGAGAVTRRIDLGVGVIPLHTRGPASIVEGVRTHAVPLARLRLGVGSPNPNALARVRDGVAALRRDLPGARVVVAALGPRMCRLAGEIADGVLFNWLTPEHARRSARLVREGAEAAKRPSPALYAYVRVAVGAAARERLAEEARRYAAIPAYARHFEGMGSKPLDTAVAADRPDALAPALAPWEGVLDEVVLRAITAHDTVQENLELVAAGKR